MDEKYFEMAEASMAARTEAAVRVRSAKAFPTEDLSEREYLTLDCKNCGEDLPDFRRKKGLLLCVLCQTRKESGVGR